MLSQIKKFIPLPLLSQYHKSLAVLANIIYGRPSEKMIVIGVTGTNGKSTTVSLIAKILEEAGYKVGATSTAIFKIAGKEWLNDKKMTMLGRFQLQRLLKEMVKAGCRYAIIETSSQGIDQYRHLGIHYDIGVFTNLTPEHLEAHGGFDNYKQAKLKLFKKLETGEIKKLGNQNITKAIIANGDDEFAVEFLDFKVAEKVVYKIPSYASADTEVLAAKDASAGKQDTRYKTQNEIAQSPITNYQLLVAENIQLTSSGTSFEVQGIKFDMQLYGLFNIYNCLAAIAVAQSQGIGLDVCRSALEKVSGVPGRMEFIDEDPASAKAMTGKQNFKILVDYAPEPESVKQLYRTIDAHKLVESGKKIIHVLGSCGGGRDISRRPVLGRLAAEEADIAIITNEDPYDDDPQLIIDQVAQGALEKGKILGQNLYKITDRREAIKFALSLAKEGDLVLLTGKGCEQAICVANGRKIPWDERNMAREEIKKLGN
jgi:UDP-N-acetylmuramoyl-L-alanyl-D-glutamate--2,6-diaminopimelate ligase